MYLYCALNEFMQGGSNNYLFFYVRMLNHGAPTYIPYQVHVGLFYKYDLTYSNEGGDLEFNFVVSQRKKSQLSIT